MAYNEALNDRVREAIAHLPSVIEKAMFGGICYMVNGKMCIGIVKDELMCRIGPDAYDNALEQNGCREMVFTGKPMKGYVYVGEEALKTKKQLQYWIGLCLDFNKDARASKKKKAK